MTQQRTPTLTGRPALPVLEQMEGAVGQALSLDTDSPTSLVVLIDQIRALPNLSNKAIQLDYAGGDGQPGRFVASPTTWLKQVYAAIAKRDGLGLRRLYLEALEEHQANQAAIHGAPPA